MRVLTRMLGDEQRVCGFVQWSDHTKRAKRRMLEVVNTGKPEQRLAAYGDLLKVARAVSIFEPHTV